MIANIEPMAGQKAGPSTMEEIAWLAGKFSVAHEALSGEVARLNEEIAELKRKAMPRIKKLVANAAEHKSNLNAAIAQSPALFERPRTVTFAGIKLGFRKGTGGIDWEDDAKTVALIKKHFPKAQADLLIKTTEKPIKKALEDLEVADLRKIGCTVEGTGDVVVIKPAAGEVDKIVNALLKDATEEV